MDALLVHYQILSEQRIHFSKLYWQSIAFLFALLVAGLALLKDEQIIPIWLCLIMSGGITILMGFIADRLRQLEARYEDCLEAIELSLQANGHSNVQLAPRAGQRGARVIVTYGLYALGAALVLFGLSAA
ncbi:MAG: hypothetical protein Rhims3KO_14490 [Hyphomicrobiales bacterium]